jgi:cysteine-rich repeat protein
LAGCNEVRELDPVLDKENRDVADQPIKTTSPSYRARRTSGILATVKPLSRSLLAMLAAGVASCAWAACTKDFDQFAPLQASASGSGTTATTGAAGGSSVSTSSGGGAGGAGAAGGGGGAGGQGGAPPVCGDGVQNGDEECDDGNQDAADGCSPACATEHPDTCPGTAVTLTRAGLTITGDTTGADNTTGQLPCGGGNSGDLVYEITPEQDGAMAATLDGQFATLLYSRSQCPGDDGDDIECSTWPGSATITMNVTAGDSFYLFVDGYGGQPEEGLFTLTLELN